MQKKAIAPTAFFLPTTHLCLLKERRWSPYTSKMYNAPDAHFSSVLCTMIVSSHPTAPLWLVIYVVATPLNVNQSGSLFLSVSRKCMHSVMTIAKYFITENVILSQMLFTNSKDARTVTWHGILVATINVISLHLLKLFKMSFVILFHYSDMFLLVLYSLFPLLLFCYLRFFSCACKCSIFY